VTRCLITTTYVLDLALVDEGKATRYGPGVMDGVVQNRLKWQQITPEQIQQAAGFVALQKKEYIGRWAWIEWPDGQLTGPYLVTDCGAAQDQDHLDAISFAVDLSYELAVKFGVIDMPRWGVRVYVQEGVRRYLDETYQIRGEET